MRMEHSTAIVPQIQRRRGLKRSQSYGVVCGAQTQRRLPLQNRVLLTDHVAHKGFKIFTTLSLKVCQLHRGLSSFLDIYLLSKNFARFIKQYSWFFFSRAFQIFRYAIVSSCNNDSFILGVPAFVLLILFLIVLCSSSC